MSKRTELVNTVTLSALILSGSMPYVCQDICHMFVRIYATDLSGSNVAEWLNVV